MLDSKKSGAEFSIEKNPASAVEAVSIDGRSRMAGADSLRPFFMPQASASRRASMEPAAPPRW